MVTIEVYWQCDGLPAKDKRVETWGTGWSGGCGTGEGWTDSNGKVHLDITPGNGKIRVAGSITYEGAIEGRVPVYI